MSSLPKIKFPLNRDDVRHYLPHRDPMLFIDRVVEADETSIRAESFIKPDAPFFKGHFPDLPILPGVLIIETVAQAGALIVSLSSGLEEGSFIAFSGVEQAKFRRPVYPEETLSIAARIDRHRRGFYKFSGEAYVGDALAAQLQFSATQMVFDQND
ncbi:3-hydroxyacyl-ACP dehydratase FabZ [Litorimonas sp.]|uniref:3-hydroxyacyl-ACP dehydratase FabZ n=1 Tax=Litorimonas sp. TaxID=1892381 RepID=UPI003A85C486